jgi:hypothetical protein
MLPAPRRRDPPDLQKVVVFEIHIAACQSQDELKVLQARTSTDCSVRNDPRCRRKACRSLRR